MGAFPGFPISGTIQSPEPPPLVDMEIAVEKYFLLYTAKFTECYFFW